MAVSDFLKEKSDDTVNTIKNRSLSYTPEWSFDTEQPDMGTALGLLFADMMGDTLKRFYRLPSKYQLQFYNLLGLEPLPPDEASGYVTFSTVNDEVPGSWIKEGERVIGKAEGEEPVIFETREALYVSPARLSRVYYVNGFSDYISQPLEFPIKVQQGGKGQSHIFYIGHDVLFGITTEGEIALDFHLSRNIRKKEQEDFLMNRITWSYYSRKGFVEFPGFRYEEGRVYLHKDTSMPPFERTVIQGKNSFWLQMKIPDMPPLSQISFPGLSLSSSGSFLAPEVVYDGNMEMERENFLPFGDHPFPYGEVYISLEEAFSKKGALLELNFRLDFLEYPGELKSPELPVKWHNIMHHSEFREPEPVDIKIDSVIWEYYNGFGWTRIPDTRGYEAIFRENSGEQDMSVKFICPEDIAPFLLTARESYCIRIRIAKMTNLYSMDGIYIVPRIKNLTVHYRSPESGMLPDFACCVNHYETKELKTFRDFSPFYNCFPDNEMLYLSFSKPLGEEGIRLLFVVKGDRKNDHARYHYEYYGKDGWKPLRVEDETRQLSRTGLVTIYREHSFVRQEFFGCPGYWLRIVRERDGKENAGRGFPVITGIYINSTTAATGMGSGKSGNLPAGAITQMERSIGFINGVTNYDVMAGGCDGENSEQAARRMAAFLRHRGRAVTAADFEDIVLHEIRNLLQVRCFSGRNEKGDRVPGHITLAVLPETEEEKHFEYVRERVYQCLLPHIDRRIYDEGRLHIVKPEWVSMKLYMEVVAKDSVRPFQFREKLIQRINAFLNPVTGNFDGTGWRIGLLPSVLQIENLCSQMEEILYVKHISLKDESLGGCYILGAGGEHEIEIIAGEEM